MSNYSVAIDFDLISAFKQFHQLYREYQQSSNDPIQEMVSHNGHINPEVVIPIDLISQLPALQVSMPVIGLIQ